MMIPGPDHPITTERANGRWRAMFAGHVIADSDDALILQEANLAPVVYFPREDVSTEYMARTDRSTHCPYKGDAGYYTILMDGEFAENAVWTYDEPFPAMSAIAGRLAFYTDKVEVYPVDDAVVNPGRREAEAADVDEVVQHTDSGAGLSQREPWRPTVETPASDEGGLR